MRRWFFKISAGRLPDQHQIEICYMLYAEKADQPLSRKSIKIVLVLNECTYRISSASCQVTIVPRSEKRSCSFNSANFSIRAVRSYLGQLSCILMVSFPSDRNTLRSMIGFAALFRGKPYLIVFEATSSKHTTARFPSFLSSLCPLQNRMICSETRVTSSKSRISSSIISPG